MLLLCVSDCMLQSRAQQEGRTAPARRASTHQHADEAITLAIFPSAH